MFPIKSTMPHRPKLMAAFRCSLLLIGALSLSPPAQSQSLTDLLKQARDAANAQLRPPPPPPPPAPSGDMPRGVPGQPNPAADAAARAGNVLAASSYDALFRKGTVTGADLYETLKKMRADLRARRSAKAWSQLTLAVDRYATIEAITSGIDVGRILQEVAVRTAIETMKATATSVSMKTLDEYLEYLLEERRGAMAEERVTLPNPQGMSAAQKERIVTMATLVVAARLSNKVLSKAQDDLNSLATDYKSLLEQREQAANLLFATLDHRRAAQRSSDAAQRAANEADLGRSLSTQDLAFIDASLNTLSVKDFSRDMAAQNLALRYMESKDPAAFKAYRTKADDVVRRTRGYVRTVSGVAAFGGMTAAFAQSAAEIAQERNLDNLLASMPLGVDFLTAAAPLAAKSVEVSFKGISVTASSGPFAGLFRGGQRAFMVMRPAKSEEVAGAKEVFAAIQSEGVSELFYNALFNTEVAGWMNRVNLCDPVESGRMVDVTVPQDERTRFATEYLGLTADTGAADFAFVNALVQPGATAKEKRLGDDLFGRDHRSRSDALPLATIQKSVTERHGRWNNEQLLTLLFRNREVGASAAYATLEIAHLAVRPVPTPDAVYVYESQVEACRKTADASLTAPQGAGRSGSTPKPPTKPDPRAPR